MLFCPPLTALGRKPRSSADLATKTPSCSRVVSNNPLGGGLVEPRDRLEAKSIVYPLATLKGSKQVSPLTEVKAFSLTKK